VTARHPEARRRLAGGGANGRMTLAREEQLILLASRPRRDEAAQARLEALVIEPLDWRYVIRTAVRHGVAPLVGKSLARAAVAAPDDTMAELDRLASISSARNARMARVLAEIVTALADDGILPVALKELGLAYEVFPEPGLRPLGDLDLLIRPGEYDAASLAMRAIGFEPLMTRGRSPYTLAYGWGHHFRRPDGNVWVDLQWNVLQREWSVTGGRRIFDPELLHDGAHAMTLPGAGAPELLVPAPEPNLLHLAAHLEGHDYAELILFCDIAEALAAWEGSLDWDEVVGLARRFEAGASLYHVLRLTAALLGATVPAEVLADLGREAFRGGLYGVFGGLNWLHFALDEIATTVRPPRSLMRRLERDVRQDVAVRRTVYEEVDALAADVRREGARLALVESAGVGRRFPDERLPRVGALRLVVLAEDLAAADAALEARGYGVDSSGGRSRELPVRSDEPLAGEQPFELAVAVRRGDPAALFASAGTSRSNSSWALESVIIRLPWTAADAPGVAPVELVAVTPETLVAALLARLGGRRHDALIAVPPVLDALRAIDRRAEPERLVQAARSRQAGDAFARGVAIMDGLGLGPALPAGLVEAVGAADDGPRVLEWAREGPDAPEGASELRTAYLVALCLLQARGGERRPLLRALTARGERDRSPLASIAAGVADGLRRAAVAGSDGQPSVYWLEP
jgi:hypothetical protein